MENREKMKDKMNDKMKYVRIQGRENAYLTGKPVGIFSAVHRLQRAGLLTDEEKAIFHEIDQVWFEENLPNPPFYDDDKPGKPITWFKTATAGFMVEKLQPLIDMLEKYSKPYDIVYSNFPGRIVYEDKWQVAVYDDNAHGRISPLSAEHFSMCADVIHKSFSAAAQNYGLNIQNCPGHWNFKNGCPFGYFVDGKLIGFVALTNIDDEVYEMSAVSVLPEYSHLGYEKSLLDFCKRKCLELGGEKIIISLADTDTILKEWYAANGFIHTGTKNFEHLPFPVGYMEWVLSE